MASNAMNEITEEFLLCQICLEDFKQPKMLPCLHTFCQPCLEKLLAREPLGKLNCPTCRQDVPLPQNGVQGLKPNFLVGKLHDILLHFKGEAPEPQKERVPCTSCCEVGNSAQFYCVECTDYLCQVCNDAHIRLRATRSHNVETVEELMVGRLATDLRARETSKCEVHKEVNSFYCDTCRRGICLHCVVTAHKDHQYVEVEKAAEREKANINAKLLTVGNTVELHEKWLQKLHSVKNEWPSQVQRTEEQLEKQAEAIMEAVQKVKNDKIRQLRAMNAAREKQMDAAMEAAEMDLASARSCIQITDNVLEYGSPAEVMSVAEELTARLEQSADKKITKKFELSKDLVNLTFEPPVGDLEQEVARLLGGIKQPTVKIPNTVLQGRPNVAIAPYGKSPKLVKTVGKKGQEDGEFCMLSSIAVTPEGNIVVADSSNQRLQCFDKDGLFKKKVDLGFNPDSVAVLANGDVLVTGDRQQIRVYDKQGRESRVIQVSTRYRPVQPNTTTTKGIAVDDLGRIVVTCDFNGWAQVLVLSPSGDIMLAIGERHNTWLSTHNHVTVSGSNQIIISDFGNHNLKVFDPAGRHVFTSGSLGNGPGQLRYPYSVITDGMDNIIVNDYGNNRVSLFSQDGAFIRHVLLGKEHGLNNPRGLTLTQDGHLVITDDHSIKFFLV